MIKRKNSEVNETKAEEGSEQQEVKVEKTAKTETKVESKEKKQEVESTEKTEVKKKPKVTAIKLSNMITAGEIKDISQLSKCGKKAIAPVLCKELESLGVELPKSFVKKITETFIVELDVLLWALLKKSKKVS